MGEILYDVSNFLLFDYRRADTVVPKSVNVQVIFAEVFIQISISAIRQIIWYFSITQKRINTKMINATSSEMRRFWRSILTLDNVG